MSLSMRRRGYTIAEMIVVMVVAGVLAAIALPRMVAATDRVRARGAAADVSAAFAGAREQALTARALVAVVLDTAGRTVMVRSRDRVVLVRDVGKLYGVRMSASRDSMSYDPRGLGFGAANLSVVLRRGQAAETVSVSRLGRVRR